MTYVVKFQDTDFADAGIAASQITNNAAVINTSSNTFTVNQTINDALNNTGYYKMPYTAYISGSGSNIDSTGGFIEITDTFGSSSMSLPQGSTALGRVFIIKNNSNKAVTLSVYGGSGGGESIKGSTSGYSVGVNTTNSAGSPFGSMQVIQKLPTDNVTWVLIK